MALDNMHVNTNLDGDRSKNPKFHFQECPFIPQNNLRLRKNFIDEHTYKYYHINFTDKICNSNKDILNINFTNADNKKQERDINNKNSMHIYHNKQKYDRKNKIYEKEEEINTGTRSDDFENRTHESEENLINHGRGKEKLLNPRKIICDVMKSETQEDGKHFIRLNKEELTLDRKCFNVSKKCDVSFAEMNESFQTGDEDEFMLSAKITVTTDISHQKHCEHQIFPGQKSKVDKIIDCKHDSQSNIVQNNVPSNLRSKNYTSFVKNKTKQDENIQAPLVLENENVITGSTTGTWPGARLCAQMKINKNFGTLQEAEEIKKLFGERDTNSKINDLYEEEQFLYDPESKEVSHSILTRSRSSNFLEYLNQIKNTTLNIKPHNELQLIRSGSLENIPPFKSRDEKKNVSSQDKSTLTKTTARVQSEASSLDISQDINVQVKPKESVSNKKLLIIESNKVNLLPSNKLNDVTPTVYPKLEINNETQTLRSQERFDQIKSTTLPSVHKRPELQKRYFYNEFKTYKRKTICFDDIPSSDQVKSNKDKFEKIFSKIIDRKSTDATDQTTMDIKTQVPERGDYSGNLIKSNQRFVSEDNICLQEKTTKEKEYFSRNNISNYLNEDSCQFQNLDGDSQNSLMKMKFAHLKQKTEDKLDSKDFIFTLKSKTGSVDNLSTKEFNNYLMKAKYLIKNKTINISEENLCENFPTTTHSSANVQNFNHGTNIEKVIPIPPGRELRANENRSATIPFKKNYNKYIHILKQPGRRIQTLKKELLRENNKRNEVMDNKNVPNKIEQKDEKGESNKTNTEDSSNSEIAMDNISSDSDTLESFGRPISEEVLSKIRECGTSITYFGGKVISRKYGPMCSPMTMTILNEIKQYMSVLNEHFHKPRDEGREI